MAITTTDLTNGLLEVTRLEKASAEIAAQAKRMREALQHDCQHPYKHLVITAGAVESYYTHAVERQLYIRCSLCDAFMQHIVAWNRDA